MPSNLLLNSELFSSYKNHTTLKALVGISPKGSMTFIGQLYTGSISDKETNTNKFWSTGVIAKLDEEKLKTGEQRSLIIVTTGPLLNQCNSALIQV